MASSFVERCPHGSEQGWGDGCFKAKAHVGWVPHSVAQHILIRLQLLTSTSEQITNTQDFKKPLEFVANPVGENPGLPESQSVAVFKARLGLTRMGAGFL